MTNKSYEQSIEKAIRDENDNLIGSTLSNLKTFRQLNETINRKINVTNEMSNEMGNKFDESTKGIKYNTQYLVSTIKNKNSLVCWVIVMLFVIIFLIRRGVYIYYRSGDVIDVKLNNEREN